MGAQNSQGPERQTFLGLHKDAWKLWLPIACLVLIGFALAVLSLDPAPPTHFKIATGSEEGAYFAFAKQYQQVLKRDVYGYDLEVISTAGSIENLALLRAGEVDLALVQGGTFDTPTTDTPTTTSQPEDDTIVDAVDPDETELRALGSLYFEPLWVFHQAERPLDKLADLVGWRIAIGEVGSGTRALTERLLSSNGIDNQNSTLVELKALEAATALEAGDLDAAFFVTSPSTAYIEALLASETVDLLSFRRHRAYSVKHRFLSRVVLGEGSVNIAENLPPEDISLLAVSASLVSRGDLHPDLIPPILETLREVHGVGGVFEAKGQFPSAAYNELPLMEEAERYLVNGPPFLYRIPGISFRVAALIDRLKILLLPLITLLLPLSKVAPPLYRWRIRSSIYRWYEDLKMVDDILRRPEEAGDLSQPIASLERLEKEVTEVQVPLSYMDEFYRLRAHIDLIRVKLERLQHERQEAGN